MTASGDLPLRRTLVVLATDTYRDPWPDLDGVREETAAITRWLCDPRLGSRRFTRTLPELADNPAQPVVRAALQEPGPSWTVDDAAFVFVTGHGEVDEQTRTHHLVLTTTDRESLRRTAIPTAELVGWLYETGVDHLFLVLDACYAGAVAADVLRNVPNVPPNWVILPSAMAGQQAVTGALTTAISGFLEELAADTGAKFGVPGDYLTVAQFVEFVGERLGAQTLTPLYGSRLGTHVCLPNPHPPVRTRVRTEQRRRDLALPAADLATHWEPRARGVRERDEPGWLFTGRARLMSELITAATGPGGVTVVTGGAGTGKSAVLARLVTLSDSTFLAERSAELGQIPAGLCPPEGAVDVAVLATGRTHGQVLEQLCGAVGLSPRPPNTGTDGWLEAWWGWLAGHDRPVTIVVDALDEAVNPEVMIRDVLGRLEPAGPPRIRLLIGTRSVGDTREDAAPAGQVLAARLRPRTIRVDADEWWDQADLIRYVTNVLLRPHGSPYRALSTPERHAIAGAIAARAGRSFLVAGLHAGSLARRDAVLDLDDPWSLRALDDGVVGVFRDDLHRTLTSAEDRARAIVLLRAVAFGMGRGLPWRPVWPAVANTIDTDDHSYGDSDILWLLSSRLNGYLVRDREDGLHVYRPFHDLLRTALRRDWRQLLVPPPQPATPAGRP